jgi:hypothetical protein
MGPKESVTGSVGADHRTGMRYRQLARNFGTTQLVDNHRLADGPSGGGESGQGLRLADSFHEQEKRVDPGVTDRQIRFVTDRHQCGKPDSLGRTTRDHRANDAPALRDAHQTSGHQFLDVEGGIDSKPDPLGTVNHAHAVGAEQPHPDRPRDLAQLLLLCLALWAGFGKTIGQDRDHLDLRRRASLDRGHNRPGSNTDVSMVDTLRQRVHRRPGLVALHRLAPRIDRINPTDIAMLVKIALRPACRLPWIVRGADDSEGSGADQSLKEAASVGITRHNLDTLCKKFTPPPPESRSSGAHHGKYHRTRSCASPRHPMTETPPNRGRFLSQRLGRQAPRTSNPPGRLPAANQSIKLRLT